jgi:hypothetical protein
VLAITTAAFAGASAPKPANTVNATKVLFITPSYDTEFNG